MTRCKRKIIRVAARCVACLLAVCLALSLTSCAITPSVTPLEVVRAMHAAEKPTPQGKIYCLSVDEDNCETLTRELITVLFGDGVYPPEMDGVRDAACFLSYRDACEISVFYCRSADEADDVAMLLLRRLELLRRERPDFAEKLESASVTVRGRWALLCISGDTPALLRVFRRTV